MTGVRPTRLRRPGHQAESRVGLALQIYPWNRHTGTGKDLNALVLAGGLTFRASDSG